MKLSKAQRHIHEQCEVILQKDILTYQEKEFIIENWNEGANNNNAAAGAFFTPYDLAWDFTLETWDDTKIIDLCAGIGALSFCAFHRHKNVQVTCIEMNANYIEVGKKILPEANWIHASIFDLEKIGSGYDIAISNPPFGKINTGELPDAKYKGSEFEFKAMEVASRIAKNGVFLVPQGSTPFIYSVNPDHKFNLGFCDLRMKSKAYNPYDKPVPRKVQKFIDETGLEFDFNLGIDTGVYLDQWKGVKPLCEVVTFDFN